LAEHGDDKCVQSASNEIEINNTEESELVMSVEYNELERRFITLKITRIWGFYLIYWLGLELPKGLNRIHVFLSYTEEGRGSIFKNTVFSMSLEFITWKKDQKRNDSERIIPVKRRWNIRLTTVNIFCVVTGVRIH
jgi:hypothetical protein